jgi:hypothetical protein
MLREHEVGGSNPLIPTTKQKTGPGGERAYSGSMKSEVYPSSTLKGIKGNYKEHPSSTLKGIKGYYKEHPSRGY